MTMFFSKLALSKTAAFASDTAVFSNKSSFSTNLSRIFTKKATEFNYIEPLCLLGQANLAREIYHGHFIFDGIIFDTEGLSPFLINIEKKAIFNNIHNFSWLMHMYAAQSPIAVAASRVLISDWIQLIDKRNNAMAYNPEVITYRLINWILYSDWLTSNTAEDFKRAFVNSIYKQTNSLYKDFALIKNREITLFASIALLLATRFLKFSNKFSSVIEKLFRQQLQYHILLDGGHISREPQKIYDILTLLLPIKQTYLKPMQHPPSILVETIERLFPCLRFFLHSNGELAHFKGGSSVTAEAIKKLLTFDDSQGGVASHAPYSKYYRLEKNDSIIIADIGKNEVKSSSGQGNISTASFEFSSKGQRFIVNSGDISLIKSPLNKDISYYSNAKLNYQSRSFAAKLFGKNIKRENLLLQPHEDEIKKGFTLTHSLKYSDKTQIQHKRRILLANDGDIISGQDKFTIENCQRELDRPIELYFHMHPDIIIKRRGCSYFLIGYNDNIWQFDCNNCSLSILQSMYNCPEKGIILTSCIVLYPTGDSSSSNNSNSSAVNWQLSRVKETLLS